MSKISKSDAEHFRTAMRDVRPLKPDNRQVPTTPKTAGSRLQKRSGQPMADGEVPAGADQGATVAEACENSRPLLRSGLQRRVLRELGSAQLQVADTLDLHGLNENQARTLLRQFLANSLRDRLRCVRVVHGKGLRSQGPAILKLLSWRLLWQHPAVLALKPCAPQDGGSGAVLVMLQASSGDSN